MEEDTVVVQEAGNVMMNLNVEFLHMETTMQSSSSSSSINEKKEVDDVMMGRSGGM